MRKTTGSEMNGHNLLIQHSTTIPSASPQPTAVHVFLRGRKTKDTDIGSPHISLVIY